MKSLLTIAIVIGFSSAFAADTTTGTTATGTNTAPTAAAATAPATTTTAPTAKTTAPTKMMNAAKETAGKLAAGQLVNINTASLKELAMLPGVGEKKAQEIIQGRPYSKIEDVMKIKGIKDGIFSKIKNNITTN